VRGWAAARVRVRQVLPRAAGLARWKSFWEEASTAEEVVWFAAREPLAQDIGEFRYSDLGYIMLTAGVARVADEPFRSVMRERVLDVVEARSCEFGPRPAQECAATEEDTEWRRKRLRGEVHDENAYAMGGVSGHARSEEHTS